MTAEEKVESDEQRLLKESFRRNRKHSSLELIAVKVKKRSSLYYMAAAMGLEYRFVKFLQGHKEREEMGFSGLMVIAHSETECDTNAEWIEMKNEVEAAKQRAKEENKSRGSLSITVFVKPFEKERIGT